MCFYSKTNRFVLIFQEKTEPLRFENLSGWFCGLYNHNKDYSVVKTFRLPSSLTGAFCLYNLLIILISSLTIYNYSPLSTNLLNSLIP